MHTQNPPIQSARFFSSPFCGSKGFFETSIPNVGNLDIFPMETLWKWCMFILKNQHLSEIFKGKTLQHLDVSNLAALFWGSKIWPGIQASEIW